MINKWKLNADKNSDILNAVSVSKSSLIELSLPESKLETSTFIPFEIEKIS